jgi:hypothetical protein
MMKNDSRSPILLYPTFEKGKNRCTFIRRQLYLEKSRLAHNNLQELKKQLKESEDSEEKEKIKYLLTRMVRLFKSSKCA